MLPAAADDLQQAAEHYETLADAATRFQKVCGKANDAGGFAQDTRTQAGDLVAAMLQAEQDAITRIEAALAVQGETE